MVKARNEFEKAFYSDGYKLGMRAVEKGLDMYSFETSIKEMFHAMDEFLESLFEFSKQQVKTIECKRGCQWCCHQPIFALDYELNFLSEFIRQNLSVEAQNEIRNKAKFKDKELSGLTGDKLLNSKIACPLLKNGVCVAYEARPMACRIYLSNSVASCKKFYNVPDDKINFPALLDFPLQVGKMMNEGFKAALKTEGWITKEYRIEQILQK